MWYVIFLELGIYIIIIYTKLYTLLYTKLYTK